MNHCAVIEDSSYIGKNFFRAREMKFINTVRKGIKKLVTLQNHILVLTAEK
jgi:hypothetical protein